MQKAYKKRKERLVANVGMVNAEVAVPTPRRFVALDGVDVDHAQLLALVILHVQNQMIMMILLMKVIIGLAMKTC